MQSSCHTYYSKGQDTTLCIFLLQQYASLQAVCLAFCMWNDSEFCTKSDALKYLQHVMKLARKVNVTSLGDIINTVNVTKDQYWTEISIYSPPYLQLLYARRWQSVTAGYIRGHDNARNEFVIEAQETSEEEHTAKNAMLFHCNNVVIVFRILISWIIA